MVDPVSSAGLASSIVTFLTLAYQVGERTRTFARLAGELPPDLQSCKDLVDVILRCSERLKAQVFDNSSQGAVAGPLTAHETDLSALFDQCAGTASEIVTLFDKVNGSSSFKKALQSIRKQGKLHSIRNELEQQILTILFVFQEGAQSLTKDIR
jgi:hypothetical protein